MRSIASRLLARHLRGHRGREKRAVQLLLRIEFQVRPQVAQRSDDVLQHLHLALGFADPPLPAEYCGKAASAIDSGLSVAFAARRCQSSSVMNGITGCSSRSVASKTVSMLRQSAFESGILAEASFFISTYQSQNSCQTKCQSVCAAS